MLFEQTARPAHTQKNNTESGHYRALVEENITDVWLLRRKISYGKLYCAPNTNHRWFLTLVISATQRLGLCHVGTFAGLQANLIVLYAQLDVKYAHVRMFHVSYFVFFWRACHSCPLLPVLFACVWCMDTGIATRALCAGTAPNAVPAAPQGKSSDTPYNTPIRVVPNAECAICFCGNRALQTRILPPQ